MRDCWKDVWLVGQNDLVKAIQLLRDGKSDTEVLQSGIDEKTLALAKTIR